MIKESMRVRYAFISVLPALLVTTFYFASQNQAQNTLTAPQQVHLSWANDPKTSMTVMWQTVDATQTSTVQYGESQKLGKETKGQTYTYGYATGTIHGAELSKLKPSTVYYYRAGDSAGGWSGTYSFKTAPAKKDDFSFIALGDVSTSQEAKKNIAHIVSEKPAFVLIAGDLSYANGKHYIWDAWFEMLQPAASYLPFMPALGNHEFEKYDKGKHGLAAYIARFSLPGNEYYYSFDYAGSHFTAVNCLETSEAQKKWLEEDLKIAVKNKLNWIIAYLHFPPFSSSTSHGSDINMRKVYNPIFEKYGVDIVLTGHDHDYERTFPMKGETVAIREMSKYKEGTGTIYVVTGGGGARLYGMKNEAPEWSAKRESVHQYLKVSVTPAKLSVTSLRTKDKSVLDAFEVIK